MKLPVVLAVIASLAAAAHANPRALPFTYTTDTLAPGKVEIEQYADLDPVKAGEGHDYFATEFLTEIEIGIADRLELGLYFTLAPHPDSNTYGTVANVPGEGSGLKQRLRYIFADPGAWPIDVGVYGELTEIDNEVELEGKILLQKRFGNLRIAANLSNEYEFYFTKQRDYVLNPSLGVTYEISPKFHLGIDSWMQGEYPLNPKPATRTFSLGPEIYVGPAYMINFGRLWWSLGAYARVTDTGHDLVAGEPYGKVYFRSMIGYDL
ncbi:MAG TPA: hypothetical protein VGM88_24400 [Kofleriaceae bacterium]|jgi:hypothetical protein